MQSDIVTRTDTSMNGSIVARCAAVLLVLGSLASPARAQQTTAEQPATQQPSAQQPSERPPARPLGQAIATSDPMGAISAVRQLPGGRVLVNDPARRRVVMLDSNMKLIKVVADTTPMTQNAYGARGGGLLPWHGDSTLFLDPASLSMLVLDGNGEIKRVMAAPRPDDVFSLVGGALGFPGFDATASFGLVAPVGTPPAIIDKLHRETVRILALPEVRKRFAELGSEVIGNSPSEFSAVIKAEIPQWAKLIKEAGIRASD